MTWLTDRELYVVRLIERGYTHDEIGSELGLSPRTAKAITRTIRLKLDVSKTRHLPRVLRDRGVNLNQEDA